MSAAASPVPAISPVEAEVLRDSILAVSGNLNPKMFGPSVYPEIPKAILAGQSMPGRSSR